MDVSVILVNYNTKELTMSCINSIYKYSHGFSFEIILVDNNSQDGSIEVFSCDKRIIFVETGENIGFGRANNIGLKYAKGKYIFFLNTDTELLNNAIKYFVDYAESKKGNTGGLGCQLLDGENKQTHSYGIFPSWKKDILFLIKNHIFRLLNKKQLGRQQENHFKSPFTPYIVDYITGADLFVPRSLLDKFGPFDSDFFMYFEETEMQYRWFKHGIKQYIIDGPLIVHFERKSMSKTSNKLSKMTRMLRSNILYYKKTIPRDEYIFYRIFIAILTLPTLCICKSTYEERKELIKLLLFNFKTEFEK